jgi:ATP-dependent protease Clp ATPase subunit
MYEIPSRQDIRRCKITEKVILKEETPTLEPIRLPSRGDDEELLVQDEPA